MVIAHLSIQELLASHMEFFCVVEVCRCSSEESRRQSVQFFQSAFQEINWNAVVEALRP